MLLERAVVNAGPLVGLSVAGRLDLLPALFAEFWIPEIVFHEVAVAGLGLPGAAALIDARWTSHVRPSPDPDPLLIAELDPGEASVIALARSLSPCLAIIDEKRGRGFPVEPADRRPGDPPILVADSSAARQTLGWNPQFTDLARIVEHAWAWERQKGLCW